MHREKKSDAKIHIFTLAMSVLKYLNCVYETLCLCVSTNKFKTSKLKLKQRVVQIDESSSIMQ